MLQLVWAPVEAGPESESEPEEAEFKEPHLPPRRLEMKAFSWLDHNRLISFGC